MGAYEIFLCIEGGRLSKGTVIRVWGGGLLIEALRYIKYLKMVTFLSKWITSLAKLVSSSKTNLFPVPIA